jgi:DNA invertase Pin-like site-specific DNA recombinase
MRLDAYTRTSKSKAEGGLSEEEQREKITKYADLHDIALTWHAHEEDVSGRSMDRPIFNEIMGKVQAGRSDGIIVAKLDRFARSLAGGVKCMAEIIALKKNLVSVADNIDLSTPTGRAMAQIVMVFAELESERRKEDFAYGQKSKIGKGVHGANPVYGYVKVNGKPLRLDPETSPHVLTMFTMRARGDSWERIAKHLDESAPRAGGGHWTGRHVARIVANRAYLGEAFYGEHVKKGAHPAIVTIDEFDAAQIVTGGRQAPTAEKGLLSGIVRCAGCRYTMRAAHEARADGSEAPYYICTKHHGGGVCKAPASIMAHLLDPLLLERLLVLSWEDTGQELGDARRVLQLADDRMREFLANDELRQIVGDAAYLTEAQKRRSSVDDAQSAIEAILRTRKQPVPASDDMTEEQMREYVRSSLDSVYVRKGKEPVAERVLVFDRGEDDLAKPSKGNGKYRTMPTPWPAARVLAKQLPAVEVLPDDGRPEGVFVDGERVGLAELRR